MKNYGTKYNLFVPCALLLAQIAPWILDSLNMSHAGHGVFLSAGHEWIEQAGMVGGSTIPLDTNSLILRRRSDHLLERVIGRVSIPI